MNRNTILNLIQSKYKIQWSRLGLILGLIIIGITNSGCSKDDVSKVDVSKDSEDVYYVKYEVNGSNTIPYNIKLNVSVKAENNQNRNITINLGPYETVVGPVKKGFNANLFVGADGQYDGIMSLSAQISISKNGSPFAVKKIGNGGTSVSTNYSIDY